MENQLTETNQTLLSNQPLSQNTDVLKTLRQVSLIFFFLIGISHIISGLLVSQSLFLPTSNLINKVLDIPFAIIALIYGFSNVHLPSENPGKRLYLTLMIIVTLVVLGILLYINLLIPDRIS